MHQECVSYEKFGVLVTDTTPLQRSQHQHNRFVPIRLQLALHARVDAVHLDSEKKGLAVHRIFFSSVLQVCA